MFAALIGVQPGKIFLVDRAAGRTVPNGAVKDAISSRRPYAAWRSSGPRRPRGP
jgi:hypothetical protein